MFWEYLKNRYIILFIIISVMGLSISARLFTLQVLKGEEYKIQSEKRLLRSMPVKAPRGEILDRYGRPLITNRMGFTIIFQKEYIKKEELNKLILDVANVMDMHGQNYIDSLPITTTYPFDFYFPDVEDEQLSEKIINFKTSKKIDVDFDANQTMEFFKEYYQIDGEYTPEELRKIVAVRYEMENRMFSNNTPYTFATDVKIEAVSYLKEQHLDFAGVNILVEPIRVNTSGTLAAHILGRVGVMYKEEYEKLKSKNYNMNDIVGKDGIEKYLEEYLRGKDGVSSIEQNINGKMSRVLDSKPPVPGNYAVLTLDAELQRTLEQSLESNIQRLRGLKDSYDASGGSAVVIDVNSGEILAMASYPTFNPNEFNENYKNLITDKNRPMFNRAIGGQYAPGSTFKILTAIAALGEGIVNTTDTIVDEGVYKFYANSGYSPVCWIWADYRRTHGAQNITQAIENSCNYFFYDVGRRLTINGLTKYGEKFGLGQYTGIELPGEAKGIFASPEYRAKYKKQWYPGDTLQASIGQSDHLFTPLQLANYIATVANGGKRYSTHIVKAIKSYEEAKNVVDIQPKVVDEIQMEPQNYKAVMDGMRNVSETGTASNVFANYRVAVGGKTGTASVPRGTANGLFVAFAPFEKPQIAIAIVVEHGGHGNYVAPIAKDVIDAYIKVNTVEDAIMPYNTLVR